ncbi:MAG: hypothetical protein JJU06_18110 [Ectothiorhodospiraceae bacterium]|nr:hypothetical protein [Ectothiorhodospiraceae bacterium]MCH8505336.1 hypothetical protein [Ectothiorhodospiraceae bacterium]
MKKQLLVGFLVMLFAGASWAHSCPRLMAEIDAVLEDEHVESHLEADVLAEAKRLREDGERYHEEGDHDRSMEALEEAMKLLAIEDNS